MTHDTEISRRNPTCIVFLIDQSDSMRDSFGGAQGHISKAVGVSDAINHLLENLVIKAAKEEGIRDYFYLGVIGYGEVVGPAFVGHLAGRDLVPVSEVGNFPARVEDRTRNVPDGAGGLIQETVKMPIWFDPKHGNGTPMCQALREADRIVTDWLSKHPDCYPPMVINITDGEVNDGDPSGEATLLRSRASSNGNVLLFNLHLSSRKSQPIEYPSADSGLPDQFAKTLFRMSSELPEPLLREAHGAGAPVGPGARGFVFNAGLVSLITFLDIGTKRDDVLR
jgi:hypothetical protein